MLQMRADWVAFPDDVLAEVCAWTVQVLLPPGIPGAAPAYSACHLLAMVDPCAEW